MTGPVPAGTTHNEDRGELSTYTELAEVIQHLGLIVREQRRRQRQSLRAAAAEIGVNLSSLARIEQGREYHSVHLLPILRWLDTHPTTRRETP